MAYLNANIPVMYSQIKREYLYDLKEHHGEVEDCIIFGLASITGRPVLFHAIMENGAVFYRLPISAFVQRGYDAKEIINAGFEKGKRKDVEAVVAYVVTASKGMKINVPVKHPKEKEMYAMGEKTFFFQAGPMDFSCASCHAEDGKRIRLQDLPNITDQKGAALGFGYWPAYRVSSGNFWTMQRRLNDCYRQQRFPEPIYTSDVTIALSVYMGAKAKDGVINTPGLKR